MFGVFPLVPAALAIVDPLEAVCLIFLTNGGGGFVYNCTKVLEGHADYVLSLVRHPDKTFLNIEIITPAIHN